jgi:antitoxin component YwqK of YwqJK toxin-antitoxin module
MFWQVTCVWLLLVVVGPVATAYAQEDYPSEKCAARQRVKSIAQYDVEVTPGVAKPRRLLIEGDFYDRGGRHTQWRQYEVGDSTQYSIRTFTYDAQGHVSKTVDLAADKTDGTIDSTATDVNGQITYRRLSRPTGQVLLEVFLATELNQHQQPSKTRIFNKQKQLQGYTLFTYSATNKLVRQASYSAQDLLAEQHTYSYYPTGTLKRMAEIKGRQDTLISQKFTPAGLLVEEIHFDQESHRRAIDYKLVKRYDGQQREIEELTYSNSFSPNGELTVSRREISQYGTTCLKAKTLIYTSDLLTKQEKLQVMFDYRYAYYE